MPDACAAPDGQVLAAHLYDPLRQLARQLLSRQNRGETLEATDLLHETYLRLGVSDGGSWTDEGHFFRAAAQAMRHILIDRARKRQAVRHGGGRIRIDLQDNHACSEDGTTELLMVDEALTRLKEVDDRLYQIVMLRYFAGLTIQEAARSAGVSAATAKRDWAFAKAWLYEELDRR
ncbi:MAG: sigma-70 family RNA polymerase sigma factor [Phycisphaerales bacterium]|nr:sigma-70 family RNA polymerase sigma factor [Phycisphaerales bacterium]